MHFSFENEETNQAWQHISNSVFYGVGISRRNCDHISGSVMDLVDMLVDKRGVKESMSPVECEVFERDSAQGEEYEFEACKKLLRG